MVAVSAFICRIRLNRSRNEADCGRPSRLALCQGHDRAGFGSRLSSSHRSAVRCLFGRSASLPSRARVTPRRTHLHIRHTTPRRASDGSRNGVARRGCAAERRKSITPRSGVTRTQRLSVDLRPLNRPCAERRRVSVSDWRGPSSVESRWNDDSQPFSISGSRPPWRSRLRQSLWQCHRRAVINFVPYSSAGNGRPIRPHRS
jgi:hypothetical protein